MARLFMLSSLFSLICSLSVAVNAKTTTIVSSNGVLGTCPTIDGYTYSTVNGTYLISCNVDYYGTNIAGSGGKTTFQGCIDKCAANPSCQSLSWIASQSTCWTKPAIYTARTSSINWAAKLISGPDPAGTVASPPSPVIVPAVPIQLGPSTDPTINGQNLSLITPALSSNLYYSSPNSGSISALNVILTITFKYPSVVLDDSSFITATCSNGALTATFSSPNAFSRAQTSWSSGPIILITASSPCSANGQNIYLVTTAISFVGSTTAIASGSTADLSSIFDDLTMDITGPTSGSSKRDLSERQAYTGGFNIPMNIAPPSASLVPSPWGNQYPFFDFSVALTDSRFVSESKDLAAMSSNGTLINVSNPPPGIQMYCVNCAVSGALSATSVIQVKSGALSKGSIVLSGAVEADIAVGVNAFTEYSLMASPYEGSILSTGLSASAFTIANVVTFTPTLDLTLTAAFDHSTSSSLGQFLAGASYKWNSVSTNLNLMAPASSANGVGSVTSPVSSSTYNVYGNVTAYLNSSIQYGLSFNVNFFNGKIVENLNVSTSAGFQAQSIYSSIASSPNNCLGISWDILRESSSDVYFNGTLATELFRQSDSSTSPFATGCAMRNISSSTTSSGSSTSQTSTSNILSSNTVTSSPTSAASSSTSSSNFVVASSTSSSDSGAPTSISIPTSSSAAVSSPPTSNFASTTVLMIEQIIMTTNATNAASTSTEVGSNSAASCSPVTVILTPSAVSTVTVTVTASASASSIGSATSPPPLCSATSVLQNGDFEGSFSLAPWEFDGSVNIEVDSRESFTGSHCMFLYTPYWGYGSSTVGGNWWAVRQNVTVCPYSQYTFAVWGDWVTTPFTVCFNNDCAVTASTTTINGWSLYERVFYGTSASSVNVTLLMPQIGDHVALDDMSFNLTGVAGTSTPSTPPTTACSVATISNAGFEGSDFTPWQYGSDHCQPSMSTSQVHTGATSFEAIVAYNEACTYSLSQLISICPNTGYEFTFWAYFSGTPGILQVCLGLFHEDCSGALPVSGTPAAAGWYQYRRLWAGSSQGQVRATIYSSALTSSLWVDDFSVTAVNYPTMRT